MGMNVRNNHTTKYVVLKQSVKRTTTRLKLDIRIDAVCGKKQLEGLK